MRYSGFVMLGLVAVLTAPCVGAAELTSQQQRMGDCNAAAAGKIGAARQEFMSSCLSNKPAASKPNCNPAKSKPCGNSCIALDKVCHK